MNADRTVRAGAIWAQTGPMLPGKATDPAVTSAVGRMFLEEVLRRDLPEHFGKETRLHAAPPLGHFGYLRACCLMRSTSNACPPPAPLSRPARGRPTMGTVSPAMIARLA